MKIFLHASVSSSLLKYSTWVIPFLPLLKTEKSVILTYKRRLKFSSSFLLTFLFSHVFWHLNGINRWFVICFKLPWTWKMFSLNDINSQQHSFESILQLKYDDINFWTIKITRYGKCDFLKCYSFLTWILIHYLILFVTKLYRLYGKTVC